MISDAALASLLEMNNGRMVRREGQQLEFKEQFSFAGLADYFRDFAAFANNRGGLIVFGVKDQPRKPVGLQPNSLDQFERVDTQQIDSNLLSVFSAAIRWEQRTFELDGKHFGVLVVHESDSKPIIAIRNEGREQQLRDGDIYYRYSGRTQRIRHAELERIIQSRVSAIDGKWRDHLTRMASIGPLGTALLDTDSGRIESTSGSTIVIDSSLAERLRFVSGEGATDGMGGQVFKLSGEVIPVDGIDNLPAVEILPIEAYPLSAMELARAVKRQVPSVSINKIWEVINEHRLKEDRNYSYYNFRTKKQRDEFMQHGALPSNVPSIYNQQAVNYLVEYFSELPVSVEN